MKQLKPSEAVIDPIDRSWNNQLVDYFKSGTFTPVITNLILVGTSTYTSRGYYQRVGQLVFFTIDFYRVSGTGTQNFSVSTTISLPIKVMETSVGSSANHCGQAMQTSHASGAGVPVRVDQTGYITNLNTTAAIGYSISGFYLGK